MQNISVTDLRFLVNLLAAVFFGAVLLLLN
jgi:hypothetical protein